MAPTVLKVPDCLGASAEQLESLFGLLNGISAGQPLGMDLSSVSWIMPTGLLGLLSFARYVASLTHNRVCLYGCQTDVRAYLERVNFFETCSNWAFTTDRVLPKNELLRSKASRNLLELKPIRNSQDVEMVADRTAGILQEWLSYASKEQSDLVLILSEMCENIIEHSCDTGHVAIQRYRWQRFRSAEVRIAVGDMGVGIRRSLERRHGRFGTSAEDYIQAALDGMSARGKDRGGNGFRKVQEIIKRANGTLFVRSENGAVRITNKIDEPILYSGLTLVPGTQVAIRLVQRTV